MTKIENFEIELDTPSFGMIPLFIIYVIIIIKEIQKSLIIKYMIQDLKNPSTWGLSKILKICFKMVILIKDVW